jgi:trk system potassium uptake protein TrkA
MNIIIIGAGEIGRHMAGKLANRSHNLCVIEKDETIIEDLNKILDVRFIQGEGASIEILKEAKASECELFLALTSDNNTNLVAASIANSLGAKKTIARVNPQIYSEQWQFNHKKHFGISHLFSPERLTAVDLAKYVRNPESVAVEELANGQIELQQVLIASNCQSDDIPIRELKLPQRVRITLIQRDGKNIVPHAGETLQEGDLVTLIGTPSQLEKTLEFFKEKSAPKVKQNVVILGGGQYGLALTKLLEGANCKIRLIEKDRERCEQLSELLSSSTTVLNADGTSVRELKEEHIEDADFFIAVTGEDEDNIMMCLQAKTLGVTYTVALVQRADYADVITEQMGITAVASPRLSTSRELLQFVTSERWQHAFHLSEGIEVVAFPITNRCPIVNMKFKEIPPIEGASFVTVIRDTGAFVPIGEDSIEPGDTLFAILTPESRIKAIKAYSR